MKPKIKITRIMINDKGNDLKKVKVVKRTNVPETLRSIPKGVKARFTHQELGGESAVRAAICRENAKYEGKEFSMDLVDFGRFYDITRR